MAGAANFVNNRHLVALKIVIHVLSLGFLVYAYYLGFSDQLGGDPAKAIIHYTGTGALNLLLLTLCVTPASRYFRQVRLVRVRRLLGLYCFLWALAHLTNFVVFDLQLNSTLLVTELTKRPYILVGMGTFLILLTLAITSIPVLVRVLGRRWKPLHRFIYVAALGACVHFYWSVKADVGEPLIYFLAVGILLLLRLRMNRAGRKKLSKP